MLSMSRRARVAQAFRSSRGLVPHHLTGPARICSPAAMSLSKLLNNLAAGADARHVYGEEPGQPHAQHGAPRQTHRGVEEVGRSSVSSGGGAADRAG